MTRMTTVAENKRAEVEDALSAISTAGILLDSQVRFRIHQAIDRDPRMTDLLSPALDVLDRTQWAIHLTKSVISGVWRHGERNRWS